MKSRLKVSCRSTNYTGKRFIQCVKFGFWGSSETAFESVGAATNVYLELGKREWIEVNKLSTTRLDFLLTQFGIAHCTQLSQQGWSRLNRKKKILCLIKLQRFVIEQKSSLRIDRLLAGAINARSVIRARESVLKSKTWNWFHQEIKSSLGVSMSV